MPGLVEEKPRFPDPRTKLVAVLCISALSFAAPGRVGGALLFAVAVAFSLLCGAWRSALCSLGIYLALSALSVALEGPLVQVSSVVDFFFLRVVTLVCLLSGFFASTSVSSLLAALRATRIPEAAVLLVATVLRFMPSLRQDIHFIAQGMRTRGRGPLFRRILVHPIAAYEGFVVPLLMRALVTANELAVSAETRGISQQCKKTSLSKVRFSLADAGLIVVVAAACAAVFIGLS